MALTAATALTAVAVDSYLYSQTSAQVLASVDVMVDYLIRVPDSSAPPPDVADQGECVTLITDSTGKLLKYYGKLPAKVPPPPLELLRSMTHNHSAEMLPESDFLGAAGLLPTGNYLVNGVSTTASDQILHLTILFTGAALLVVLMVLALALRSLSKRWLRPLESVVTTARRIADGDLSHRVEVSDSSLEVHSLTHSFNLMLSRLQESFARRQRAEDRLRQFVASAGHELRTPLSAISGYVQLAQMGALDVPEKLDDALRRIGDETGRMTALIEELLLLAELDQARPYESRPVDLGPLCLDAVHDARAAGPEWVLEHNITTNRYLVIGDTFRLQQIVANLLANIRVHTPPGTRAKLIMSSFDDHHVIDVLDDGPGIPPGLREQVFGRLFRAGSNSHSGSGLGLSIVAELIGCHGGTVRALPAEHGCWFRIELPAMVVRSQVPSDGANLPADERNMNSK